MFIIKVEVNNCSQSRGLVLMDDVRTYVVSVRYWLCAKRSRV